MRVGLFVCITAFDSRRYHRAVSLPCSLHSSCSQGHDSTKESKNKLLVELRKYQNRSVESSQRDNTHSHDSAIDTGEWESDSFNGSYKLINLTKVLPRKDKIAVEQGVFVKESTLHDVVCGDRIIAINNQLLNENSLQEVRDLLEPTNIRLLRLQRMTTPACDMHDVMDNSFASPKSVENQQLSPQNVSHGVLLYSVTSTF